MNTRLVWLVISMLCIVSTLLIEHGVTAAAINGQYKSKTVELVSFDRRGAFLDEMTTMETSHESSEEQSTVPPTLSAGKY